MTGIKRDKQIKINLIVTAIRVQNYNNKNNNDVQYFKELPTSTTLVVFGKC